MRSPMRGLQRECAVYVANDSHCFTKPRALQVTTTSEALKRVAALASMLGL